MSFNAIREKKILANISEFTVLDVQMLILSYLFWIYNVIYDVQQLNTFLYKIYLFILLSQSVIYWV